MVLDLARLSCSHTSQTATKQVAGAERLTIPSVGSWVAHVIVITVTTAAIIVVPCQ